MSGINVVANSEKGRYGGKMCFGDSDVQSSQLFFRCTANYRHSISYIYLICLTYNNFLAIELQIL